jgi:MFS family permease
MLLATVNINPPPGVDITPGAQLPGTPELRMLISGLGTWALMAALVGMLLGAALWALGHHSANYQQAANGRKGLLVAGLAALVIGAAPALINFFFVLGGSVKSP